MVARHNAIQKERATGAKSRAPQPDTPRGGVQRNSAADETTAAAAGGPATTAELDRLIHERVRLAIVSALAVNESLAFNDLKDLLKTTDGNLSVHARKLEDAGYVTCTKFFDGRTPKTEFRLTVAGRRALGRYLDHMEAVIRATRGR